MVAYFSRMRLTQKGMQKAAMTQMCQPYNLHREVWKLFPGMGCSERPFIYTVVDSGRTIYCVSTVIPECKDGTWDIETKDYDPVIHEGDYYRFYTCVNPTVANRSTGKHQRHDVVMNLKAERRLAGESVDMRDIINESVTDWFIRKGSLNGFEPVTDFELNIHSYEQHTSYKAGTCKISFSTVVIEGILQVTDALEFKNMLMNGIGASKGFGCGMVMIKRP